MALATRPEEAVDVGVVAGELLRLTRQYGFNTHKDTMLNEETRHEFQSRLGRFVKAQKLSWSASLSLMKGLIRVALAKARVDAVPRRDELPHFLINELTLAWACRLLTLGYYGLNPESGIDALKREVVWLLRQFGYPMYHDHMLFCPGLNDWTKLEMLLRAVRDDNAQSLVVLPVPDGQFPPACASCAVLALEAAQD